MNELPDVWTDPFTGIIEGMESMESEENSDSANPAVAAEESESAVESAEPPNLEDLIHLIQELNQCNSVLLDRVSQLEEALEVSQKALQEEFQEPEALPVPQELPQDIHTAQEQVISLYNQLEFSHQTNQRQQILIETLTEQLENSQERIAQLEREAALLQQRTQDQAQLLVQADSLRRDLQARLHRQQRYTLQFKAALEKSLEVPPPQYEKAEAAAATGGAASAFLPKVQQIQPWSSTVEHVDIKLPWIKAQEPKLPTVQSNSPETAGLAEDAWSVVEAVSPLPAVDEEPLESVFGEAAQNEGPAESRETEAVADPSLIAKLDEMIQPLADLLTQTVFKQQPSPESPIPETAPTKPEIEETAAVNEEIAAANPVTPTAEREEVAEPIAPTPTAPAPSVDPAMADAEDALWQDLARLIDVSTEEVVKASMSGDFSAFESIDFDAVQSQQSPVPQPPPASPAPTSASQPKAPKQPPKKRSKATPIPTQPVETAETPATPIHIASAPVLPGIGKESHSSEIPALTQSPHGPAPLVYPLRPAKKRQSLAMVELPNFLDPDSPKPMPT